MDERNFHVFRNGAGARTLEFGHLESGEAYVRETGRGDIIQLCYDVPHPRRASASGREARRARSAS